MRGQEFVNRQHAVGLFAFCIYTARVHGWLGARLPPPMTPELDAPPAYLQGLDWIDAPAGVPWHQGNGQAGQRG